MVTSNWEISCSASVMGYKLISATLWTSGLLTLSVWVQGFVLHSVANCPFHKQYREYSKVLAKFILYPYYWCLKEQEDMLTFFFFPLELIPVRYFLTSYFSIFFFCLFPFYSFLTTCVFSHYKLLKIDFFFSFWSGCARYFSVIRQGKVKNKNTIKVQHWKNFSRKK